MAQANKGKVESIVTIHYACPNCFAAKRYTDQAPRRLNNMSSGYEVVRSSTDEAARTTFVPGSTMSDEHCPD